MLKSPPRIIIAALKGGSGKTLISLGLASAWKRKGRDVSVFKKGPDFIDSGWLTIAAGRDCVNLDFFMMTPSQITDSFLYNSDDSEISLIEGNRGVYDGLDSDGCCSTAELAKLLKSPVILVIDITMTTRTVAAIILGCQKFDPDLKIDGVILNRVAGKRQETIVRDSVEKYCELSVVGSIPKLNEQLFPERHMGLVPHQERGQAEKAIIQARKIVEDNLDLDLIWKIAHHRDPLKISTVYPEPESALATEGHRPRIGFIRDNCFWFYYPENLDHLRKLGADLIEIDSLNCKELPELDALYIGGGFPETKAGILQSNKGFRESIKKAVDSGLPVYAECGGLIYMGEALIINGEKYQMTGVLPISFLMGHKPQGHGYTILEVKKENPYFPMGEILKGHEFHYSRPVINENCKINPVFYVHRGHGLDGHVDGISYKNLLATYTHLHSTGNRSWGRYLVNRAIKSQKHKI
ncbi:MAG: cobyrinate a,c-diamide synthase [Deltaproteobacteria bacterium]|nr:cobyrinate a,c-diamide synthase [Deltaproteobacteria bacterium]